MLIHRKPNEPKMVYLDQNKWIDLGLAYHHQPRGARFAATLKQIQAAVRQNVVRLPFSDIHMLETMKMGDASRRHRLAQVMAEFSLGWSIAPNHKIARSEFDIALAKAFNKPIVLIPPIVFGQGVEFAFGQPLHAPIFLKLLNSSDEKLKEKGIEALTFLLSSPVETLRKPGVDKYNTKMNTIATQVDGIRNLVRNRDRDIRHRAYMARQVFDDLNDRSNDLHASLAQIGQSFEDFIALDREGLDKFYEDVPTLDVITKLKMSRHDQFNNTISANDLNDLSFLAVAIPYCDIVVTERQWVAFAKNKGLDQKYKTVLLSDLKELENHL